MGQGREVDRRQGRLSSVRRPAIVHAGAMDLHYLLFDFSDDGSGAGSFDAMAAVRPDRMPALLGEIGAVLRWAHRAFGAAGAVREEGEWDFDLQAVADPNRPLSVAYDAASGEVRAGDAGGALTTVTLTLTGSPAFCEALRHRFALAD
jgi:hypothetical protein